MKITRVTPHLVGNRWKNWLFVRVETDEGIDGAGEGTLNSFCATVRTAISELEPHFIGADPFNIERLCEQMHRDVYSDGGQIHGAAVAAIEIACWDIVGKSLGVPIHQLLGGRYRDKVRVYANGWYTVPREPDAFVQAAARVVSLGFTAMKFDPFGSAWRVQSPYEEDRSLALVEAVRSEVGRDIDLMIEGHNRFNVTTALRIAERLAPFNPTWFEEPIPHHNIPAMISVARRSAVPIATGESFTSLQQFGELLASEAIGIVQPEPLHLGGLWRTRQVAGMAEAHYAVIAPHNAQGPICSAISLQLAACVPNFFIQESFDIFNDAWTRSLIEPQIEVVDGHITVNDRPGLGVTVDWQKLADHPPQAGNALYLFEEGWEARGQTA